jgi:hypothetical protein
MGTEPHVPLQKGGTFTQDNDGHAFERRSERVTDAIAETRQDSTGSGRWHHNNCSPTCVKPQIQG